MHHLFLHLAAWPLPWLGTDALSPYFISQPSSTVVQAYVYKPRVGVFPGSYSEGKHHLAWYPVTWVPEVSMFTHISSCFFTCGKKVVKGVGERRSSV